MKKFWVNVESKENVENATFTACYGTLDNAIAYAYDYLCDHSFGWNYITICDETWNVVYREKL